MKEKFTFLKSGKLIDKDLELVLVKKTHADPVKGYVPGYKFEMRQAANPGVIGAIRLRIGSPIKLCYPGHIGFEVKEKYRGHRYGAEVADFFFPSHAHTA